MAKRLADGSIQLSDGRIVYANSVILAKDICELVPILCPPADGGAIFPGLFRGGSGGGGGGGGSRGEQGVPGIQGPPGPPGPINQVQDEGSNLPVESILNFIGNGVDAVDNPGAGTTDITINDLFAATRIVSDDPDEGTDLTIQDAVDNLPAEGGTIFIKQGTYPVATTIVLPDKSIVFRGSGWGTILDMGTGVFSLFTIPDILTEQRDYSFEYLWMRGAGVVGQVGVTVDSSSAFGQVTFCNAKITEIEVPVDVTNGDLTYFRPVWINFNYCSVFAPVGLVTGKFIRASSNGGAYLYALVTTLNGVIADDYIFSGAVGWSFDADTDLRGSDNVFALVENGSSTVAGLFLTNTDMYCFFLAAANRHILTANGLNWAGGASQTCETILFSGMVVIWNFRPGFIGCNFQESDVTLRGERGSLTDCIMFGNSKVFVGDGTSSFGSRARLKGCVFQSTSDVAVTIAAAADYAKIDGCHFRLQSTAGIQTAAQRTTVTGCTFEESGATKTVSEVGGADRTLGVGNNGVSSGGGLSITGANSKFVIGDYNIA